MKNPTDRFNKMTKKGFTLIELIVTLAIITIIATASVPQVQMWTARNRGKAAISNIISDFAKAKAIGSYSMSEGNAPNTSIYHDYDLQRPVTAIMYRKSTYTIIQRPITDSSAWKDDGAGNHIIVKKVSLSPKVIIENVNTAGTTDGSGSSPTFIFTAAGRLRQSNGQLVPLGAGAGGLKCGTENSPLDGRRIFVAVIKSEIVSGKEIWYRLEIDPSGEYFVCTQLLNNESGTDAPDFLNNSNVLEM